MKPLTCAAARRRLGALYDGELPVAEQIAVEAHLDWCDACAHGLAELQTVGSVLRGGSFARAVLTHEEAAAFTAALVGRSKAEQDMSLLARVQKFRGPQEAADMFRAEGGRAAHAVRLLACGPPVRASHKTPASRTAAGCVLSSHFACAT